MSMIQGKSIVRPKRQEANYVKTTRQIVEAIIPIIPDGKEFDWFAHDPEAKASLCVSDGKYCGEKSEVSAQLGGTICEKKTTNYRTVSTDGKTGGIYVDGPGTYEVDGAAISLSGDATGIGGPASGAATNHGGELTLRNAVIDVSGLTHYATAAENNSILRVYDSVLSSHGAPFLHGEPQPMKPMQTPPPPLMIAGNSRTHCSMTNSQTYFYNTIISADGWGAISTEAAEGYVYVEANDCKITTVARGYAAYVDPGCYVNMNRCMIDTADMAGIVGGEGEMNFDDCDVYCGHNFLLIHGVFGCPEEVSYVTVSDSMVRSVDDAMLIKSRNVVVNCIDSDIKAENGVIIHSILNDDFLATKVGKDPFGVEINFIDMNAEGDIIHEDSERDMWLYLSSSNVRGKINGAYVSMDKGSKWFATADSEITLMDEVLLGQIDAPVGVTITIHGEGEMKVSLPSGGTLVVTE